MSIDILYILSNKDKYYKYSSYLKEHTLSKESFIILKDLDLYFSQHPSIMDVDWDSFATWFRVVQHPMFNPDKQQLYQEMFTLLQAKTSINNDTEESLLQTFIERDFATQIANLSLKTAEGETKGNLSDVQTLLDEFHKETGKMAHIDAYEVVDTLSDILAKVTGTGLDWRLKCLNRSVGPLRKGDLIIIGARPDSGKTTLLASEVTHMAHQLPADEVVLWFNNEEQGWKVKYRIIQAAIGWEGKDISNNEQQAWDEYIKLLGDKKIVIVDKADLHIKDVNHYLKKHKAGLIVFDQLWKVHGFDKKGTNDVTNQTLLANQAREWAKTWAPIINAHQADGTAEGVQYITQNQLYGSKTGIQGEADAIITLGRSHSPGLEKSRFIFVPKNKMMGGPLSIPAEKNGKYEIEFLTDKARFKEA